MRRGLGRILLGEVRVDAIRTFFIDKFSFFC
jgi:hypothetical protein